MAKPGVTVTLLLCFIALSYAFTPLDLPQSDVYLSIHHDSDPVTAAKTDTTDPELTESNTVQTVDDLPSSQILIVDHLTLTRPETIVGFRPINRHFNVERQFGFRLPSGGCNHHHKKGLHGRREVSYGNDMILGEGGNHHHHRYHDRNGLLEFPFEREVEDEYKPNSGNQENRFTNKIRKFLNHF